MTDEILCIGGELHGQRYEFIGEIMKYRLEEAFPQDCEELTETSIAVKHQTYRLERIGEGRWTRDVYLLETIPPSQILKYLVERL